MDCLIVGVKTEENEVEEVEEVKGEGEVEGVVEGVLVGELCVWYPCPEGVGPPLNKSLNSPALLLLFLRRLGGLGTDPKISPVPPNLSVSLFSCKAPE